MADELIDFIHSVGDTLSLGVALGTLFAYLPSIAALLSVAWSCIRFYEWQRDKRKAR